MYRINHNTLHSFCSSVTNTSLEVLGSSNQATNLNLICDIVLPPVRDFPCYHFFTSRPAAQIDISQPGYTPLSRVVGLRVIDVYWFTVSWTFIHSHNPALGAVANLRTSQDIQFEPPIKLSDGLFRCSAVHYNVRLNQCRGTALRK